MSTKVTAVFVGAAFLLGACSGSDPSENVAGLEGQEQFEAIYENAGASPDLARCYADVLVSAGVEKVNDLNELSAALASITPEQQQSMDSCLAEDGNE